VLFFVLIICSILYSKKRKEISLIILPPLIILNIFSQNFPHFWILELISINLVYFVLGVIFTSYIKTEYFSGPKILTGTFLSFVLAQWFFHAELSLKYTDRGIFSLVLAVISILFVTSLSVNLSKKPNPLLTSLGAASMAVYLMHIIVGSGARILLKRIFLLESPFLHLIFGCVFAIVIPLLAVKIFEKYKIKYLFSAPVCSWVTSTYGSTRRIFCR
jgi:peptidoglycan/LPS O-acetylase OafA/YrhL